MITQEEIKNELKDIRFYYSKKTMFEAAFKETKGNNISEDFGSIFCRWVNSG